MDGRVEQSRAEQSECALDAWWGVKYIVSIHTYIYEPCDCCCSSVLSVPWRGTVVFFEMGHEGAKPNMENLSL